MRFLARLRAASPRMRRYAALPTAPQIYRLSDLVIGACRADRLGEPMTPADAIALIHALAALIAALAQLIASLRGPPG